MIRAIVAIDEKRGIANDQTIPWLGKIPTDTRYYRGKVKGSTIIMGHRQYKESSAPYPESKNYVALNDKTIKLREGFDPVYDARSFMLQATEDVWSLGGAIFYESTFDLVEEIYITQLEGDFHCTKFFPEFKDKFKLVSKSESITESNITYTFQIWRKIRS